MEGACPSMFLDSATPLTEASLSRYLDPAGWHSTRNSYSISQYVALWSDTHSRRIPGATFLLIESLSAMSQHRLVLAVMF